MAVDWTDALYSGTGTGGGGTGTEVDPKYTADKAILATKSDIQALQASLDAYLPLSGGTLTGNLNMDNNHIVNAVLDSNGGA